MQGETQISRAEGKIRKLHLRPRRCAPVPETLAALAEADLITLGSGSLYTSVIPNLLVEGIPKAIRESQAPVVYISNLMWQPGETDGYSASDHLRAMHEHSSADLVDMVVLSSSRNPRRRPPALCRLRSAAGQERPPPAGEIGRARHPGGFNGGRPDDSTRPGPAGAAACPTRWSSR